MYKTIRSQTVDKIYYFSAMQDKPVFLIMETVKDIPILGGFFTVLFAKFDHTTNYLLQITDFNLDISDAVMVWDSIVRTIVSFGTLLLIAWRIRAVKKKINK